MAMRGIEMGEEKHVKLYAFLKIVILIFGLTVEILLLAVDSEQLKQFKNYEVAIHMIYGVQ